MRLIPLAAVLFFSLLLNSASVPAATPKGGSDATVHYTQDQCDVTVSTTPDGRILISVAALPGTSNAPGAATHPALTPQRRLDIRLFAIQTALEMQPGDEWDVIASRVERVLKDQFWLETDADGTLLVLAKPALADPENPLAEPAKKLLAANAAGTLPPNADLKTLLAQLRDSRHKVEDMLARDQSDLQKLITVRQEFILVRTGVLK